MSVLKKSSIKKWLIGSHERKSPLSLAVYYSVLIGIGFIYVYPILYMLVNSFMSPADLADPSISWIPSELFFGNFKKAFAALDLEKSFKLAYNDRAAYALSNSCCVCCRVWACKI